MTMVEASTIARIDISQRTQQMRSRRGTCVLSASTFDNEGGIQRVTQMVLRFLQNELADPDIELFSLHDREESCRIANTRGSEIKSKGLQYRSFSSSRRNYSSSVIQRLHRNMPALIVLDHAHLSLLPQLAYPLKRQPSIVSFVYHAELPTLSGLRRWSVRRSDVIVAISEFAASEAQRVLGTDCPIALCRLGLFPEYEQRVPTTFTPPPIMSGKKPILIVGRMADGTRDKGHEVLIRAMPAVANRIPEALLVIVGRGGDEGRLRSLCRSLNADHCVHFAGYVPDEELSAYYRTAEVFAMPSYAEGFGLVYLEAMFHSKPCIAGNLDAAREVISHEETGLLVTPGNVAHVETALLRLLMDPELAVRFGAAGRKRFESHFTYSHFTTRLRRALSGLPPALFKQSSDT